MKIEVKAPKISEEINKITIVKWFKGLGDRVKEQDVLAEGTTKKIIFDIKSPASGRIEEILVKEGEEVPSDTVIAVIDSKSNFSAPQNILQEKVKLTVRERIPITGVQKEIKEHIWKSVQSTVHVTEVIKVDITLLNELLERNAFSRENEEIKILDILIKAVALSLPYFPALNSCAGKDEIISYKDINIGFTVFTEKSLIVPVIKSVDKKEVYEIYKERKALTQKAKTGTLSISDVSGGTFSIVDLSLSNVFFFNPIINYPQVAVLGIGSVQDELSVRHKKIEVRKILYITISFDQRLITGIYASGFLNKIKGILEEPDKIFPVA